MKILEVTAILLALAIILFLYITYLLLLAIVFSKKAIHFPFNWAMTLQTLICMKTALIGPTKKDLASALYLDFLEGSLKKAQTPQGLEMESHFLIVIQIQSFSVQEHFLKHLL